MLHKLLRHVTAQGGPGDSDVYGFGHAPVLGTRKGHQNCLALTKNIKLLKHFYVCACFARGGKERKKHVYVT